MTTSFQAIVSFKEDNKLAPCVGSCPFKPTLSRGEQVANIVRWFNEQRFKMMDPRMQNPDTLWKTHRVPASTLEILDGGVIQVKEAFLQEEEILEGLLSLTSSGEQVDNRWSWEIFEWSLTWQDPEWRK